MPWRSKKQRGFMHIHHPEIAAEWDRKYGGKIVGKKKGPTSKKRGPKKRG